MQTIPELASAQSWQSATLSRRKDICHAILERLPGGFELVKPFVCAEPAEGAAREIPCFYDARHETSLALVFGGEVTYGATAQRSAELRREIAEPNWPLIAWGWGRAYPRISDGPLSHIRVGAGRACGAV